MSEADANLHAGAHSVSQTDVRLCSRSSKALGPIKSNFFDEQAPPLVFVPTKDPLMRFAFFAKSTEAPDDNRRRFLHFLFSVASV